MICIRHAARVGLIIMLAAGPAIAADEPDELMPGRIVLIRPGVIAKFVAKAATTFDLPDSGNSPVAEGAMLSIFDTGGSTADSYSLPSAGWKALGSPAGSKGYKYKGAGSVGDPCRVVLVKAKVVKAVCKGGGVQLVTPFTGDVGIVLAVGTDTKTYCARFGGTLVRNDSGQLKRTSAPAPGACPTASNPTTTTTVGTSSTTVIGSSTTTSTVGGACCGGYDFMRFTGDGVSGASCGSIRNNDGSEYAPVICGGPPCGNIQSSWRVSHVMVRCECTTPFGSAVVPDV